MKTRLTLALAAALLAACQQPPASAAQVTADANNPTAPISYRQLGTNLATWGAPVTDPAVPANLGFLNARLVRWPGGLTADTYHWERHVDCTPRWDSNGNFLGYTAGPAYRSEDTFPNFVSNVLSAGREAVITVAYGTNATCGGPGNPAEAANWVSYAKSHSLNIHYWTVGNEQYGGWSYDAHTPAHDGPTYAAAISGTGGYYAKMKAADSTAKVGVVVEGAGWNYWDGWDRAVLKAPFDFVEDHWYAQQSGSESDSYLLTQAPADFDAHVRTLRGELSLAGKSIATPIMLGEFNSVADNAGKQSMSIVNALFMGQMFTHVIQDKVAVATAWFGMGGSKSCDNNNSTALYGWQNFGGYDAVAYNTQYAWNGCPDNSLVVPEGAALPVGWAQRLASQFAADGESLLGVSVDSSLSSVRAFAATQGAGYAFLLFNLDGANAQTVTLGVANAGAPSYAATTQTYGKAQYDDSQRNVWTGPAAASLGTVNASSFSVALSPWSMVLVTLK